MRVPIYDQQENSAAMPAEHLGLENVGAGGEALAQGVSRLGQAGQAVLSDVEKARYQAADLEVTHAHIALAKVRDQVLHGTTVEAQDAAQASTMPAGPPGTPSSPATGPAAVQGAAASVGGQDAAAIPTEGVLNSKGLKGVYASQPALLYLDKARDAIAAKLSTPYAQRKFHDESEETLQTVHTAVEQHAAQQMQEAKQTGLQDFMAVGINFAANNYNQPSAIAQQMAAVDKSIRSLANSPEEAESTSLAFHQHVHEAVLNQYMAAKDWQGAQAYLSTAKSDLGAASAHYGSIIANGVEKQQGDATALKLVGDATDHASGLVNVPKLIGAANALPEAQRTEALKEAVRGQLHLADAQNVATAGGHFNTALSAYLKRNSLADVSAADQTWLQANDPKGWLSLQEIAARNAREAQRGPKGSTPDQDLAYAKAVDLYSSGRPEDVPPPEQIAHDFGGRLTQKQLQLLQDAATKLRDPKIQSDHGLRNDQREILLEGARDALGIGRGDKTPVADWDGKKAGAYFQAEDALVKQRAAYRAAHKGEEPPPETVKSWAAAEFVKVKVGGTGGILSGDDEVPLATYRSNPDYRGKPAAVQYVDKKPWYQSNTTTEIPVEKYDEIRARAQKKLGREPTPDEVRGIFNALPKAPPVAPAPAAPKAQLDLVHPTNRLVLADQPDFTPAPPPRAKLKPPEKKAAPGKSTPLAGAQAELTKALSTTDTNQGGL